MRHFLRAPRAPGALTRRVRTRSAVAELVALAGAAQRLAPANPRALTGTVAIAAVAVAADAHLLRTAPAAVEPIRLLACPHAPHTRPLDNAAYCGHKGNANAPLCARACRRPGVLSRNLPGPSLFRRSGRRIAHTAPAKYASPAPQSHCDHHRLDVPGRLIQFTGGPAGRSTRAQSNAKSLAQAKHRGELF